MVISEFNEFEIETLRKVKVIIIKNKNDKICTYFEVVDYEKLLVLGLNDCVGLNYNMNNANEIKKCDNNLVIYLAVVLDFLK